MKLGSWERCCVWRVHAELQFVHTQVSCCSQCCRMFRAIDSWMLWVCCWHPKVCVCASAVPLEETGWGNVSGSFSSKWRLVVAFHSHGSLFTALGWCHRSVQVIFFPFSWNKYFKPYPGAILCVGLNQQQGWETSLDLKPWGASHYLQMLPSSLCCSLASLLTCFGSPAGPNFRM